MGTARELSSPALGESHRWLFSWRHSPQFEIDRGPHKTNSLLLTAMHLGQVFFVTVAILLVSSDSAVSSQEEGTKSIQDALLSPSSNYDNQRTRALRADDNSEERGFWSNLFKEAKVRWWLETGKSETQVKKALKLDELSGKSLETNTKFFQKLVTKAYANKLNKWLKKLKSSPAYRTYVDYVNQFDDLSQRKWGAYKLPKMVGSSKAEMMAKSSIWGEAKRSDEYVKMALGMEGVTGKALKEHTNYAYYMNFLKALKGN